MVVIFGNMSMFSVSAEDNALNVNFDDILVSVRTTEKETASKETDINALELSIDEHAVLKISGEKDTNIIFKGELYPFLEGLYKDELILGEFEANGGYQVSEFRISTSDKTLMTFKLYDTVTSKEYSISAPVSEKKFTLINDSSRNTSVVLKANETSRIDYLDKLVQLDLKEKSKTSTVSTSTEELQTEISGLTEKVSVVAEKIATATKSSNTELDDFSYSDLKDFIEDIKSSGNSGVNISTTGISESFFTSTGWDHSGSWSSPMFKASKYTFNNGNGVYYTRITMMDLDVDNNFSGSTIFDAHITSAIKYGVMIEYVDGTDTAKLYLDDYGLKVYKVEFAIGKLTGDYDNIFANREVTGQVSEDNHDITGLIGLIPHTQYFTALWGTFSTEGTNQFQAGPYDLGSTVALQLARYDDVVRTISMNSNTTYMQDENDRMRLTGEIRFDNTVSYSSGMKYWVKTY